MTEKNLEFWVKKMQRMELPIMGKTVDVLRTAEQFIEAHSSKITETILQDTNMTASILKLANSALYSRKGNISTISRAILTLGFEVIRSICISSLLLDSITQKSSPYLQQAIAYSFQSAVQAKMLAEENRVDKPEAIYIAALLYNLGEIAFWSSGDKLTFAMSEAIHNGANFEKTQQKLLGFQFTELTKSMTKDWKLSDMLLDALDQNVVRSSVHSQLIVLSNKISRELAKGWEHDEVKHQINHTAKLLNLKSERITEVLCNASDITISTLRNLKLKNAAAYIPLPPKSKLRKHEPKIIDIDQTAFKLASKQQQDFQNNTEHAKTNIDPKIAEQADQTVVLKKNTVLPPDSEALQINKHLKFLKPDVSLQMSILRDLSMLATENKLDINLILQLVLEGMYKGMGMDRALVSLIIPSQNLLMCKYVVEAVPSGIKERFRFAYSDIKQEMLLLQILEQHKVVSNALAVNKKSPSSKLITDALGVNEFIAGPLVVKDKCVGIFYTDRQLSGRAIAEDSIESFKFFVSQATLCLRNIHK